MSCAVCGAEVSDERKQDHENWHFQLAELRQRVHNIGDAQTSILGRLEGVRFELRQLQATVRRIELRK